MNNVLKLTHVARNYTQGSDTLEILRDVNLALHSGEVVALVGPSGSGKSTLLQIAGLLDSPTSGEIEISGEPLQNANDKSRTQARLKHIGFVYQAHHLLPEFSALENVMIPQMIAGFTEAAARDYAQELLEKLHLGNRKTHRPARLSGGEQQRVAIARALANQPSLLLADEPTGNLDPKTADEVFAIFMALAKEQKLGCLVATHNMDLAQRMDRTLRIEGGRLI